MKILFVLMGLVNLAGAVNVNAAGISKLECENDGGVQLVVEYLGGGDAKITLTDPKGASGEWKSKAVQTGSGFEQVSTYALNGHPDPLEVISHKRFGRAGPIGYSYSAKIGALNFFDCGEHFNDLQD